MANILATPDETLNDSSGQWAHNNKVKYIKETARSCATSGSRVPDTMEGLLALPGVGPR